MAQGSEHIVSAVMSLEPVFSQIGMGPQRRELHSWEVKLKCNPPLGEKSRETVGGLYLNGLCLFHGEVLGTLKRLREPI